jgi:hypothetical protein
MGLMVKDRPHHPPKISLRAVAATIVSPKQKLTGKQGIDSGTRMSRLSLALMSMVSHPQQCFLLGRLQKFYTTVKKARP